MFRTPIAWLFVAPLLALAPFFTRAAQIERTAPAEGLRENPPEVHALVGARIWLSPGNVLETGTLVIRGGRIEAVGAAVKPPADARIWNLPGRTVYAGLIDAYSTAGAGEPPAPAHGNAMVLSNYSVADRYQGDAERNRRYRNSGFVARLLVPAEGIIRGTSALVSTDDLASTAVLVASVAQHAQLRPGGRDRERDPNSPMGAVALVRQTLLDAQWHEQAWKRYESQQGLPRPERRPALAELAPCVAGEMPLVVDAPDELYALRAHRLGAEFGLRVVLRGSGREYRRLEEIAATGRVILLPIDFPKPPDVRTPEAARSVSLASLMHWDIAPENPARLVASGVRIALTTDGLKELDLFLPALRKAVARGLAPADALRAVTLAPAEILGVSEHLGSLAAGKAASLIVCDGDLFAEKTKVVATWVDGRAFPVVTEPAVDPRGQWQLSFTPPKSDAATLTLEISGLPDALKAIVARGDQKAEASFASLEAQRLVFVLPEGAVGLPGIVRVSGLLMRKSDGTPRWEGDVTWPNGESTPFTAQFIGPTKTPDAKPVETAASPTGQAATPSASATTTQSKPEGEVNPAESKPNLSAAASDAKTTGSEQAPPKTEPANALYAPNFPLGAHGVEAAPEQPRDVAFTGATIWTCGASGVLTGATVLVHEGRIAAVGTGLAIPEGATVVDCTGKHLTPGIIDCHSHIATDGGVNETGQGITAEVRIGDFIDCDDVNIYRQLAGGVTSSNILHGSANPIGGQNQVIKLRWGLIDEAMKFAGAPPGIKFALGENVKQSNWGDRFTSRYPQTRLAVEQIIRDEFRAAEDYRRRHDAWQAGLAALPPRRDLELEAVAEILAGRRLIHCHSYRQDEILMLLRLCEEFHVRIATLQHVLEGYKVADQIARHGAGGSSFSDWWAYKFEVYDAIPYNGALMHRAGVVVSFNSDDAELARRLNLEAAKAVKYGDLPPEEALRFVTLNPAIQLGIADRVGSIEVGKDADLAVWSGPPLSGYSRCESTWVDGRRYFDRQDDALRQTRDAERRAALVARVLISKESPAGPGEGKADARALWPRDDLFCHPHHRHHDDERDHGVHEHAESETGNDDQLHHSYRAEAP